MVLNISFNQQPWLLGGTRKRRKTTFDLESKKKNSPSASGFIYKYSRHKKNHSTFKWLSGS